MIGELRRDNASGHLMRAAGGHLSMIHCNHCCGVPPATFTVVFSGITPCACYASPYRQVVSDPNVTVVLTFEQPDVANCRWRGTASVTVAFYSDYPDCKIEDSRETHDWTVLLAWDPAGHAWELIFSDPQNGDVLFDGWNAGDCSDALAFTNRYVEHDCYNVVVDRGYGGSGTATPAW